MAKRTRSDHRLQAEDFTKIASGGFGDHTMRIVQAMAWFQGALYVGTGGRSLNPMGLSDAAMEKLGPFARMALDRKAGKEGGTPGGASIWRFTPQDGQWQRVFQAPDMDHQGRKVPRDRNIRASVVLTEADGSPSLYFGVSAMKGRLRLIRTRDGVTFEEAPTTGLGLPDGADIPSIRSLVAAEGSVFSSPVGMIEGRGMLDDNMSAFPMVFRADHPFSPLWQPISAPGFGNPDNLSVNEIAILDGWIYAGTLNIRTGAELWRCPLTAQRPDAWQKVFDQGAGFGPAMSIVAATHVFKGHLYLATGLQRQGKNGIDRYGPVGGEVLRVAPSGDWDLICGQNRVTKDGWKAPLSGMGPSFDEPLARGIWHMADHDGVLYACGADWRMFTSYLPPPDSRLPPEALADLHADHALYEGGFPLWCSPDGMNWTTVARYAFENNPETGGARFLQSAPGGLFIGTASTGKTAARGGLEVWFGADHARGAP